MDVELHDLTTEIYYKCVKCVMVDITEQTARQKLKRIGQFDGSDARCNTLLKKILDFFKPLTTRFPLSRRSHVSSSLFQKMYSA